MSSDVCATLSDICGGMPLVVRCPGATPVHPTFHTCPQPHTPPHTLQTTATIYSLVGALNKIPVALVGLLAFHEPTNPKNLASIILGLLAGVVFVQAKNMQGKR